MQKLFWEVFPFPQKPTFMQFSISPHCNLWKKDSWFTAQIPLPNRECFVASKALPKPSSWQTIDASFKSQSSSHTVPHCPSWNTSTRPSRLVLPSINRTKGVFGFAGNREATGLIEPQSGKHFKPSEKYKFPWLRRFRFLKEQHEESFRSFACVRGFK